MTRLMIALLAIPLISVAQFSVAQAGETAAEKEGFHWKAGDGVIHLMHGSAPVIGYMHAYDTSSEERAHETYKVFHHVYGPGTDTIITKGAGGKYTHHRGMYVGWNKTKTADGMFDFWHCKSGAHLKHVKVIEQKADVDSASMTTEIHWNDASGKPVIREHRTVSVTAVETESSDVPAWQIDWSTTLNSERGKISLGGDRQHAGFQFRADQYVADKNGATYIRPAEFSQEAAPIQVGDAGNPPKHINLNWFAMTFELPVKTDGNSEVDRFTIGYFEMPGQPRPSLYSERPYGRFGAFYKAEIDTDSPLEMQYRVLVINGKPTRDELQKRYETFVSK